MSEGSLFRATGSARKKDNMLTIVANKRYHVFFKQF